MNSLYEFLRWLVLQEQESAITQNHPFLEGNEQLHECEKPMILNHVEKVNQDSPVPLEFESNSQEEFYPLKGFVAPSSDQTQRSELRSAVLKAIFRFPKLFNLSLYKSYERMVVNCPDLFLSERSSFHLKKILCVQFFLQKRMESALQKESGRQLLLKLFRGPSRICVAIANSSTRPFQKEQLFKAIDVLLPGINEVPRSFYLWHSGTDPYFYSYFEVDKLRGKEISSKHLGNLETALQEQLLASSPLTPALFWPYNKEESHRQIQLLVREMTDEQDMPHIAIHFQEQTASSLEFLIHLVRPKSKRPFTLEDLPESLSFFRYSKHVINTPFTIEIEAFSIRLPAQIFDVRDSINLLYARRYLVKQLEKIIGPFRDYNGGLFEKQQDHFEKMRIQLAAKIPYFDIFAEKVFYALHPFERWLFLSIDEVEELFRLFSELIRDSKPNTARSTALFTVVKSENRIDSLQSQEKLKAIALLIIGNFHYECFSGQVSEEIESIMHKPSKEENTLKLVFQEGTPPSLNPHYSSSDMRSRLLNKMLFEGLTRLNPLGEPELTGASSYQKSIDGHIYTFRMRKAAWSNGETVTAIDYADSWRGSLEDYVSHPEVLFCIKNAKKYREKQCSIDQVGIEVIDPLTLRVELEKPDPEFLEKLSQPFFFPLFGTRREPKWFNGPYIVQGVTKSALRLERNPYYWKNGEDQFEHAEVRFIETPEQIFSLFQEGKIDWIGDPLSILSVPQIRELEKEGRLRKKIVGRRFILLFNTQHPILSSKAIRQALNLAIDRSHICQEIFPHSIPIQERGYSKESAKAFLEEGLRELNLKRLPTLTFSYSNQTRRDHLAEYLQETWSKNLGIEIQLKRDRWNPFRSQLEKRQFEICCTIQDTLKEDSIEFLERFEGENSYNFSGWTHLVYRELLQSAKAESDLEKSEKLKGQAAEVLSENIPFIPLFNYVHLYSLHPRFDCFSFDEEGCVDFSQGKHL